MARGSPVTCVALLRGVNVGGKGIIRMSSLKKTFEDLGFERVSTYINSGNVIFRTRERNAARLEKRIEQRVLEEHGLVTRVLLRTLEQMEDLMKRWPKGFASDAAWRHNVVFLARPADDEGIVAGLGARKGMEKVVYVPGALFWSAAIATISRSAMLRLSGKPIYREMTARNPNTTRTLYQRMRAAALDASGSGT